MKTGAGGGGVDDGGADGRKLDSVASKPRPCFMGFRVRQVRNGHSCCTFRIFPNEIGWNLGTKRAVRGTRNVSSAGVACPRDPQDSP